MKRTKQRRALLRAFENGVHPLDAEEDSLFYALNNFRADNGVGAAVATCKSLNVAASAHADDMRDHGYLSDEAPDGSTARERACDAGFKAACDKNAAFAELVASGIDAGEGTLKQWSNDATTK